MTYQAIWSKALICLYAILVAAFAFGECGAIILAVNSFTRPVEMDPHNRVIICAIAFMGIAFVYSTFRILADQLSTDGEIEYEVRDLFETQCKADRLRDVLGIGPNEAMTSIWVARWLYDAFRDHYEIHLWEMESLFRTFGLENRWHEDGCDDEQGHNAPDQSEPPPRSTTNLYDDWHDDNHLYDDGDPGEWWKYQ